MPEFTVRPGGAVPWLEDQGYQIDDTFDMCSLVNILKDAASEQLIVYPDGYTPDDLGVSRPEDSDGYRVMVRPGGTNGGKEFWLASKLIFPGNANGLVYDDVLAEINRVAVTATWLLSQWPAG